EDYDMNRSSYIAYGEWPSGSASGALLRLSKLPARVLQETLSKTDRDSSGHSPFDYTETLIVKVTEEAHDALQKEIQRYNRVETAPPLTYALISNDCATFAATIATELGLHPPERNALTPGTWLPEAFIVKFREQVTQPLTMQYPGG